MHNDLRRVGTIAPPGNVAVEREFPLFAPPGVVINHNRLSRPNSVQTKDSILAMNATLEQTARDLAQCAPEVIAYVCTGGSFLEGIGAEDSPAERIEKATGIPAVATSFSVVQALRSFGARQLMLVAPYPDDIMESEVAFLHHYGFQVARWDSFGCQTSEANRQVRSEQVHDKVLSHRDVIAGCDAVFISCTNMLAMDQIDRLEAALQKPVVNSNQSTLWAALSRIGVDTSGIPAGRLFRQPYTAPGRRAA